MTEKKFKQVCQCENCGNEAEMIITCSLIPDDVTPARTPTKSADSTAHHHDGIKGHAVCSQCGSEADIWIDDIDNLRKI